jgi:hypothetical protein
MPEEEEYAESEDDFDMPEGQDLLEDDGAEQPRPMPQRPQAPKGRPPIYGPNAQQQPRPVQAQQQRPQPQQQARPQSQQQPRVQEPVPAAPKPVAKDVSRYIPYTMPARSGILDAMKGEPLNEETDKLDLLIALMAKVLNDLEDIKRKV